MASRAGRGTRGRGTGLRPDGRYLEWRREASDDGWAPGEEPPPIVTSVRVEHPRSIISRNDSPDIPFEASINPYRGCEHGCVYCYARPTHAWLDLSPGVDFESKLTAKPEAAALLSRELAARGYRCTPIAMGTNTDPYQPVEKEWRITRDLIRVLHDCDHPLTIVTKSWRVERDMDLLQDMARKQLVQVYLSVTTLDHGLARTMEPRAAAPARRLRTISALHEAGIPVGVMFAPVIPFLNDSEMESVLGAAADAGARWAGYVMLRLPLEIRDLFQSWLGEHVPLKAERVMNAIRDMRGGRENDARFHTRQTGTGTLAGILRSRFDLACRRHGLNRKRLELRTDLFSPPRSGPAQISLF